MCEKHLAQKRFGDFVPICVLNTIFEGEQGGLLEGFWNAFNVFYQSRFLIFAEWFTEEKIECF